MNDFLEQVYYNNTVREYLITLSIILGGIVVVRALKRFIITRLQNWAAKTPGKWDNYTIETISRFIIPLFQWTIVYWAIQLLDLSDRTERFIQIATSIIVTYYILRLVSSLVTLLLTSGIRKRERGEIKIKQLGGLMMIMNGVIWFLGIVFLLSNWGVKVTPIIAGLGIGGIAVALAAQNILGDLFSYFVIFFDRPFEAGDFIIVDDKSGTIEYVGIKTTQIRALSGEQIIIGNSNLTNSRIHNFKRMVQRRVVFTLEVEYGTPLETLKQIPDLLKSLVQKHKLTTFDRAHFTTYREWSLRFEVVYFVLSADANLYMNIQQDINFEIYQEFERLGINFAMPRQSMTIRNKNDESAENLD